MTATPEERARAVWRECFDGRRSTKAAVDIIAQAIREAEDAALERARQLVLEGHDEAWMNQAEQARWDRAAARIRALKHNKD